MNDEIKYWLEGLDELSFNKVLDYITNLQQENERLKETIKHYEDTKWNELEEWIMQDVKDEKPDLYFQVLRKVDILDKMKEIKGEK